MVLLGVTSGATMPDEMGSVRVDMEIENPARPGERRTLRSVLVDTGAELSWVPAEILESLGRWIRVVGTLIVFAPDVLPAQDPSIVAPGAKLERLFDEGFFTEGPAQAPDGSVYFSDITVGKASGYQAGHIWRWDPRTRTSAVFRSPSGMSNGMVFDGQGRLVVAEGAAFGGRRITRTDMKTGKSVILAALFDGR